MDIEEIRGRDDLQLVLDLQDLRKQLFHIRFRGSPDEIRDTSRSSSIKRAIARIHTVLSQRGVKSSVVAAPEKISAPTPPPVAKAKAKPMAKPAAAPKSSKGKTKS